MNRRILHVLLAGFFVLLLAACRRESGGLITSTDPGMDAETVKAGVSGMVVDERSVAVAGAQVKAGGQITTTNQYGYFRFDHIDLSKVNATVKVEYNGYFNAYRTFPATANRSHHIRVQLIPKTITGNFNASTGGSITLAGGAKVEMPATAVTDAAGNAYTGIVNVAMAWIDPTGANMPATIPGSLRGITTTGAERVLETYGMIGVELTGSSGQPLQIAAGKTARLQFPLPAAIQAAAPATIALWHFDEATARWKEEGTAVKNGNYYEARVNHFSFWNCDAPFPLVNLCMTLVNSSNNQPLAYTQVRIRRVNAGPGLMVTAGFTDSLGNVCGAVPQNEALVLEVLASCNIPVYTQPIGPFAANASLGTIGITIPAVYQLTLTGQLTNCAGAPVNNGVLSLYLANGFYQNVMVTNGSFSIPVVNCTGAAVSFTAVAFNSADLQFSNPVGASGTSGTINMGVIQTCGITVPEFMRVTIGNDVYLLIPPADTLKLLSFTSSSFYGMLEGFKAPGAIYSSTTSFGITGAVPGSYPINTYTLQVGTLAYNFSPTFSQVHITEFGPPGTGFVAGNYTMHVVIFPGPSPHTISTQFRVRRPL